MREFCLNIFLLQKYDKFNEILSMIRDFTDGRNIYALLLLSFFPSSLRASYVEGENEYRMNELN